MEFLYYKGEFMKEIFVLNRNVAMDNIIWGNVSGPTYCYLEITRRCNCRCQYCQVGDQVAKDIDIYLFRNIIDKLHLSNTFEIRLGGGEPLLCPNISSLLKYIYSKKMSVWICTNGTLLTRTMCEMLLANHVVGVRISIDSLDHKIHNKVRGMHNCLELALKGASIAKKTGLQVAICMTIGTHNIDEVKQVKKYAHDNGYQFYSHYIMPVGKGKTYLQNNSLPSNSIVQQLNDIYGEKNCVAVNQSISIDIDGYVSPCTFIKPIIHISNIKTKNILMDKSLQKYTYPVPENHCFDCQFNSTKRNHKCILSSICKGGCWAIYEQDK